MLRSQTQVSVVWDRWPMETRQGGEYLISWMGGMNASMGILQRCLR
jgi:hypothetical protein